MKLKDEFEGKIPFCWIYLLRALEVLPSILRNHGSSLGQGKVNQLGGVFINGRPLPKLLRYPSIRLDNILAQKVAPKVLEWPSYGNFGNVTQNPHFQKKERRGNQMAK